MLSWVQALHGDRAGGRALRGARRPYVTYAAFVTLVTFLMGCAGYRLGPTNGLRAGERSIQINSFLNQTIEPRLSDAITVSLRKNLQRDGTYHLDTSNEGDIIVTGAIVNYDRLQLSFQPTDIL